MVASMRRDTACGKGVNHRLIITRGSTLVEATPACRKRPKVRTDVGVWNVSVISTGMSLFVVVET